MEALKEASDLFLILILRDGGSKVLVLARNELPQVEIPKRVRIAERSCHEVEHHWGIATYCLFVHEIARAPGAGPARRKFYAILEGRTAEQTVPEGAEWIARGDVERCCRGEEG